MVPGWKKVILNCIIAAVQSNAMRMKYALFAWPQTDIVLCDIVYFASKGRPMLSVTWEGGEGQADPYPYEAATKDQKVPLTSLGLLACFKGDPGE